MRGSTGDVAPGCGQKRENGPRRTGHVGDIRPDLAQRSHAAGTGFPTASSPHGEPGTESCAGLGAATSPRPSAAVTSRSVSRTPRKKTRASYASIPWTLIASKRVRTMSGLGLRVLLCAHALWRGKAPLLLPTATVPCVLGVERVSFARGRDEVTAAGLLAKTRAHIPPGGAGAGVTGMQRAAEWDIPHAHRGALVPLDHGDERLAGYWRLMSADLLQLVGVERTVDGSLRQYLTDDQLRVVIALVDGARTKWGALADPEKHRVTARDVVDRLPGLKLRTAQRALAALESRGLARKVSEASGRRPAVYEPDGLLAAGLPWARKKKA